MPSPLINLAKLLRRLRESFSLNSANKLSLNLPGDLLQNGSPVGGSTPYQSFLAVLRQSGVDAPIIEEIFNDTGMTITSAYVDVGIYKLLFSASVDRDKTVILPENPHSDPGAINVFGAGFDRNSSSSNYILLSTSDTLLVGQINGLLYYTAIEIRIYPSDG